MQRIELKGLSQQQIDQFLPEGRFYLPVRRWCAAYASFLRLILSFSRSVRDERSSANAAVSSLTSGAAAQGNACVAPQALASTAWAPS